MALRIVPAASHAHHLEASPSAPSAPGVHDTLRSNLSLTQPISSSDSSSSKATAATPISSHPLEARLSRWRAQQAALKSELLRRQFGIAEPVKRDMERSIVAAGEWRPACLNGVPGLGGFAGASVHGDILDGRDAEIDWEDVFTGEELRNPVDFHAEMEGRFRMAW